MRNISKKLLTATLLLSIFAICSCTKDEESAISKEHKAEFIECFEYGVYTDGASTFVFNKDMHQIYHSGDKLKFYISNDIATIFLKINMITPPNMGGTVDVKIEHSKKLNAFSDMTFNVIREDELRLWLWNSKNHTGLIIMK